MREWKAWMSLSISFFSHHPILIGPNWVKPVGFNHSWAQRTPFRCGSPWFCHPGGKSGEFVCERRRHQWWFPARNHGDRVGIWLLFGKCDKQLIPRQLPSLVLIIHLIWATQPSGSDVVNTSPLLHRAFVRVRFFPSAPPSIGRLAHGTQTSACVSNQ